MTDTIGGIVGTGIVLGFGLATLNAVSKGMQPKGVTVLVRFEAVDGRSGRIKLSFPTEPTNEQIKLRLKRLGHNVSLIRDVKYLNQGALF